MKSTKGSLQRIVQNDKNYILFIKISAFLIVISYFTCLFIGFRYLSIEKSPNFLYYFIDNTLPFISMVPWIILIKFILYPYSLIDKICQNGKDLEKLLKIEVGNISNIENILLHLKELQNILGKIITIKNIFGKIFTIETNKALLKYVAIISHNALSLLKNFRNDLSINIENELEQIYDAKDELVPNINSKKYAQISELQSARLERQIEQFEELQKVLVKI